MATNQRLQAIVDGIIKREWITPESSQADVARAYRTICEWERVSDEHEDDRASWNEGRPWGTGPNESYWEFEQAIMRMWWGRHDRPPLEWPETHTPNDRALAAEFGINPANLEGALWLQTQDGLCRHYAHLVSEYQPIAGLRFRNLEFFIRAAKELGAAGVKQYDQAKTWAKANQIADALGCSAADSLMLEAVLPNRLGDIAAWTSVLHDAGGTTVAHVMRHVPHATPHAVKVVLRVPEAQESPYFVEMAAYLPSAWDTIPTDTIKRILHEEPWRPVKPEYRTWLLAGKSPQALIAHLWEPVDRHTAHRWITETGGHVRPAVFYAVRVVGIPEVEFERLIGYRDQIEKIVLDWYARKRIGANMTQERPWRLPDGTLIRVSLMAMIDEVRPEHLVNGVHTDPDHVFMTIMNTKQHISARNREPTGHRTMEELRKAEMRCTPFPAWPERTPIPGITQVRSWDRLIEIGNREQHCAGAYAERCARGETFMFEVDLDGAFSLFQISSGGDLIQHRAKGNSEPIDSHRRAVEQWVEWNKPELP